MPLVCLGLLLASLGVAAAQTFETPLPAPSPSQASRDRVAPATREELLEQERREKALHVTPPQKDRVEAVFDRAEDVLERIFGVANGPGVRIGGLVTGSGFALGPEYRRTDLLDGRMHFRTSAVASFRKFYAVDALVSFPELFGDRAQLDLYARRRDLPSLPYYGPGPDSNREGRTQYRLEDTSGDFRLGYRPHRRVLIGGTGGALYLNTGPGTDARFGQMARVYSPAQAPGLDRQTDFLRGGPFVQFDSRDFPGDPHSGTNVESVFRYFRDQDLRQYSFRRFETRLQHYIPFLNRKRVIALGASTSFSFENPRQRVPFYLQPTLGGSDELRGFRPFRFYGNNALAYSAEYRWEVAPPLAMALFVDAGRVFDRPGAFSHRELEYSGGFGFRVKTRSAVVTRLDVGFSREGFQIWFKFGDVYQSLFNNLVRQ